jgi:transketolase
MRNAVTKKITQFAAENPSVFLVTGDAGFGVLDEYQEKFPERFLNLGVAEQNMISFAAGLGMTGLKVFVYNIIPFVLYRCFEQVRNDVCYQDIPITLVGTGSGVTYSPMGMTHYSVEDVALARTLPNLTILSPSDPVEAEKCAEFALSSEHPVYIRVAKQGEPRIHEEDILGIEEPIVVSEGQGIAVLFHGSIAEEVLKAVENLEVAPRLVSVPLLQPLNFNSLCGTLKNIQTLITVEEHFIDGGLGSIISEWIAKERLPFKIRKMGIANEFIHAIRDNRGMRRYYKVSSEDIRQVIKDEYQKL